MVNRPTGILRSEQTPGGERKDYCYSYTSRRRVALLHIKKAWVYAFPPRERRRARGQASCAHSLLCSVCTYVTRRASVRRKRRFRVTNSSSTNSRGGGAGVVVSPHRPVGGDDKST
eukprot:8996142-Pyramimonas_sp.AAC.1